jgi:hypothetical protein
MAQGKGGVYGSFVMVHLEKGTSQRYKQDGKREKPKDGAKSTKSPMVYIKEPIAKYFGFKIVDIQAMMTMRTKVVKTKINGQDVATKTLVSMGATGASRSVTVKFKRLTNIGGKEVASVKIAMPSSHTFGNMVQEITLRTDVVSNIAAIVSPDGKTLTLGTAYNSKRKKTK